MIVLGIDTARGWAIGTPGKQIIDAGTVPGLEQMIEVIARLAGGHEIDHVRIERPANKRVYHRFGQNDRQMRKIAVNVGENLERASSLYYYCVGLGLRASYVNPVRGGTKLSAKQIEALTGWTKPVSEHARDAIVICWLAQKAG